MNKKIFIIAAVLAISACDTETENSQTLCTTVENSRIETDGTGFRDVISVQSGSIENVGYMKNGVLVSHSECSASYIDSSTSKFSWFQFGNKVENNSVHSIQYYTNSGGQLSSKTERLDLEGRWQEQYVENGTVTKQIWKKQSLFDQVVVVDNFDGAGIKEAVVTNGKLTKTKRFNPNTAQYDCSWDNDGTVTNDVGCVAESANDIAIFGTNVDSDFYISQLNQATVTYELDANELIKDVRRYW